MLYLDFSFVKFGAIPNNYISNFILGHPWIVDDTVAPDQPLDSAVLSRLKHFSAMNKLKKMALRVCFLGRFPFFLILNIPVISVK